MLQQNVKILLVLGMLAAVCGTASAAMGIIAETQTTSAGAYPVCTAPCECISEIAAAQRWGAEGYDQCSKTICGQSADAMVQYYCFHQIGGTTSAGKSGTSPIATAAAGTQVTTLAPVQTQVQTLVQTPASAVPVNPSPAATLQTPYPIQTKSPLGSATVFAAIGMVLLAVIAGREK